MKLMNKELWNDPIKAAQGFVRDPVNWQVSWPVDEQVIGELE